MGSWNGTDGFGGMPLRSGDKIKVVIIQNETDLPEASGFCYSNGYALPISFILEGNYNDYGCIENIDENSVSAKLFLNYFHKELEVGNIKIKSDQYYDNEDFGKNKRVYSKLSINKLIKVIERDRVFMKSRSYVRNSEEFTNIGIMMFSDLIFSNLNKSIPLKEVRTDVQYFVEDVLLSNEIPLSADKADTLKTLKEEVDPDSKTLKLISYLENKEFSFDEGWKSDSRKVEKWYNSVENFSRLDNFRVDSFRAYYDTLKNGDFNKEVIEKTLFDMLSLNSYMSSLRRSWSALGGKGGQDFENTAFLALAKGIQDQAISEYFELKGQTVYCYENYFDFIENEAYKVLDVRDGNLVFNLNGKVITLTFNEYDKCMEN